MSFITNDFLLPILQFIIAGARCLICYVYDLLLFSLPPSVLGTMSCSYFLWFFLLFCSRRHCTIICRNATSVNSLTSNCYLVTCLTYHVTVRNWCLCMSLQSQPGQQHGLQTKYRDWASGAPGGTHRKQLHQQSNSEYHHIQWTGQSHGTAAP